MEWKEKKRRQEKKRKELTLPKMCAMLSTKADVIFLQETTNDWEKCILTLLVLSKRCFSAKIIFIIWATNNTTSVILFALYTLEFCEIPFFSFIYFLYKYIHKSSLSSVVLTAAGLPIVLFCRDDF
jgi:hypothetical protein